MESIEDIKEIPYGKYSFSELRKLCNEIYGLSQGGFHQVYRNVKPTFDNRKWIRHEGREGRKGKVEPRIIIEINEESRSIFDKGRKNLQERIEQGKLREVKAKT